MQSAEAVTSVSMPPYSGRNVIRYRRMAVLDSGQELSKHRLADLVDPLNVVYDEDGWRLACQRGRVDGRGQAPTACVGGDFGQ